MCREELMNREDRKAWKHMAKQADKIHTALKDRNESLAPTTEEWIESRRKKDETGRIKQDSERA